MCGIAAILLHPQERSAADWQAIREIFTRNLVANEDRGQAATGLAVVQLDGTVAMHKLPLPASQFVQTPAYQVLLARLGNQTTLILGHTRLPTKGSPDHAENNHPVQAGPVFGVHNGQVSNDDALFNRFGYRRQAQVDSEVIFRLLEPTSPLSENNEYLEAILPRLQLLDGQYTFLACDQRRPERLLVLKHLNPLCIHYHPTWKAMIFSSRYLFLRKAFGRALITEALDHDQLLLFDALALPRMGNRPFAAIPFDPQPDVSYPH